jgi:hypothetical protein
LLRYTRNDERKEKQFADADQQYTKKALSRDKAFVEVVLTFCFWHYFVILTTGRISLF